MKLFKNFSFRKLLYNKKFSIALSILVAFVFWLIIVIDQNPVMERTLDNIPVKITTEDTILARFGLEVVNEVKQQVDVTVSGPNYIVKSIKSDDIIINADLDKVSDAGTYQINLEASLSSNSNACDFTLEPSTITVKFDYFDEKQFTVIPDISGYEKVEGLTYDDPVVTNSKDSTITIKGPRTDISKIEKVVSYYRTDKKITTTATFNGEVKFLDKNGQEIDKSIFTFDSETISISVPVVKTKTITFKPSYTNLPNNAVKTILDSLIKTDTTSFTVAGPPDVIDKLESVEFTPIDISKISTKNKTNTFEVTPILPSGVRIMDAIQTISVSFDTSVLTDKQLKITNIDAEGTLPSGLKATFPSKVYVNICGHKTLVLTLNPDDVYLSVDLSNVSVGDSIVKATIKTKNQMAIWQVDSCEIMVSIQ